MDYFDPENIRQLLAHSPVWAVFVAQFFATLVYVGIKAAQQHNVLKYRYLIVWPFSFIMAAMEYYVIAVVAVTLNPLMIVAAGLGGAIGSNVAMYLNQHYLRGYQDGQKT